MRYERNTLIQLRQRYAGVVKAGFQVYEQEIRYLRDFIVKTPSLRSIANLLEVSAPDLDPDQWVTEHFGHFQYSWPPSEAERCKVCWRLIGRWSEGENAATVAESISNETNFNASLRELTTAVVEPLIRYLEEQLGTTSDILYLLEKYRRRVEWFEQARLYQAVASDRSVGESVVDRDLRQFLFDQGVDYPFSQPTSASGKADVVADVDSEDPLVCELKLYDGDHYGVPYIAQGANQAFRYARDYGKPAAYLVVANMSDQRLQIESDSEARDWPPRLHDAAVVIFVVVVQLKPLGPASKQRGATTRMISRADLLEGGE